MSRSRIEVVLAVLEHFNGGDVEATLELLSKDFVAEVPPSMSAEPDVYVGREGALRYIRGFEGLLEDVRFEPLEVFEEDRHVIVVLRLSGRGASSGVEVALQAAVVNRVEEGKITRTQPFPDLEAARESLRAIE